VLLACACFKSDKLTSRKILGCAVGFCGILALNLGGTESGQFTWLGDGMIILNAICGATANLMTRGLSRRVDVFVGTGYSLTVGGLLLIIPGLAFGGTLPHVNILGIVCLLLLIAISAIGFALYNKLLSLNPVGKVAIYNSTHSSLSSVPLPPASVSGKRSMPNMPLPEDSLHLASTSSIKERTDAPSLLN